MRFKDIGEFIGLLSQLEKFDSFEDILDNGNDILNTVAMSVNKNQTLQSFLDQSKFANEISGYAASTAATTANTVAKEANTIAKEQNTVATEANSVAEEVNTTATTASGNAALGASGKFTSLSVASKGLLASISPLTVAMLGLGAAFIGYSIYNKIIEENIQSASKAAQAWKESSDSLQSQAEKITELKTALDSGKLSEEEVYQTKSELLSIQESLTDSYGKQAEGIDLVNGSLESQLNLLSEISKKEAQDYVNREGFGIEKIEDKMEKSRTYYLGQISNVTDGEKELQNIVRNFSTRGITSTQSSDGTYTIEFKGDATQAEETLNDFATEVRKVQQTFGDSYLLDSMSDNISSSLRKNNEILSNYQKDYETFQRMKLVADERLFGTDESNQKTPITWINEYSTAIKEYNDALAEGDTSKIDEASEKFNNLDTTISTLLANTDMSEFASQFEGMREQLNETVIAQKEFNDAMNGQDTSGIGKNIKKYADQLKELSMTDTDFKIAFETDGIQKGEDAVKSIINLAKFRGIKDIQEIIDLLIQAGVLINDVASEASATGKQIATDIADIVASEDSIFKKATENLKSANKGDTYNSMYEMVKKAKELVKSGDIGTDDFKSIAEMFSPTGADDYNNWVENLGKIERYFTEDNSGVLNFLNDLKKNNFAKYNEDTQEWTYSINDLEQAARKMGMGFEPFMAMFGKLEDKGFYNDFFSTAEEGSVKLSDLTDELFQAQRELQYLEKYDNGNTTAIQAKKDEIQEYKDRIDACKKSLAELLNENGGVEGSVEETKLNQGLVKEQVKEFNKTSKKKEYRGDNRSLLIPTAEKIIDAGKESGLDLQLKEYETKTGEIRYKLVLEGTEEAEKSLNDLEEKGRTVPIKVDAKELENIEDNIPDEDALKRTAKLIGEDNATPIITDWNNMEAIDKDTTLTGKDKATAVINLWNSLIADDKNATLSGEDLATKVIETWNGLTPEKKQAVLEADTSDASKNIDDILGKTNDVDKTEANPTINIVDHAIPTINTVFSKMNRLDGTSSTVKINEVTTKTTIRKEKSFPFNGTFHSDGTFNSYANGTSKNVSIRKDEEAVINEVGKEGIVRDGKLFVFNNGYPTKVRLKRGDIVFNHKQLMELEKKGYVTNSHAKIVGGESAFAEGTILSNAYSTGGGNTSLLEKSLESKKSTKKTTNKSKTKKKKKDSKNKKWDKFEKWLSKLFDHIEKKLDNLSKKTERWVTLAENAVTYSGKASNYKQSIWATQTEINANQKASKKYLSEAKTVGVKGAKAAGIKNPRKWTNDILTKLQNGVLLDKNGKLKKSAIKEYGEKAQSIISSMNEWVQKSEDASDKVRELTDSFADLYKELYNLANTKASEKVEQINHKLDILSTGYEMTNSLEGKQSNIQAQNQKAKETVNAYNEASASTSKYLKDAQNALKKLKINANGINGVDPTDKMSVAQLRAVTRYNAALEANKEALKNAEKAQVDYNKTLYDNAHQLFQNIVGEYEYQREKIDQTATRIESAMKLNEAKGYRNSKVYYESTLSNKQERYANLQESLTNAEKALEENLKNNPAYYGSDNYKEEVRAINNTINQMDELNIQIAETQNAIQELDWSNFVKLQEEISRVSDEASFLIEELSRKDLTDNDTAGLTDEGRAVMALYAGNYEIAKKRVEMYSKKIADWKQYMTDNNLEDNDRARDHLNDLIDTQREYAKSCQDSKYAMIDLAKEGLEAQKNYLQDIINKYKDLMSTQEDAYEYQRNLNNAVKEITDVQKQIEVYAGDTSEENRARVQQLNKDLKDKQESLQDMQRQKLTSDINKMFDDLMDNYGDYIDDISEKLDDNFDELITAVNDRLGETIKTIKDTSESLGIKISKELEGIQTGGAGQSTGGTEESKGDIEQSVEDALKGIEKDQNNTVGNVDDKGSKDITNINKEEQNLDDTRKEAVNKGIAEQKKTTTTKPSTTTSTTNKTSATTNKTTSTTAKKTSSSSKSKGTQGDGKVQVGDKVKFKSGKYYSSSSGASPTGTKNVGKQVYITKVYTKGSKPYHISTGKKLGSGDLGWVTKSQISGYAKGSKNIPKDMIAQIGERGHEIVYRSADGSILTPLGNGDKVFTHKMSDNLWNMAQWDIPSFNNMKQLTRSNVSNNGATVIQLNGNIELPNVYDAKEFTAQLKQVIKSDSRVQGLLMDSTVNKALSQNYNSLNVNKW